MLSVGNLELRRAAQSDLQAVIALQRAAYARNRALLGVEPLPLQADYTAIFRDYEVWVTGDDAIGGVLIPEARARALGLGTTRLYTGAALRHLVDWYSRHGYAVERIEELSDRTITHMLKHLGTSPSAVD